MSWAAVAGMVACGDSTGVEGPQSVALNFRVAEAPAAPGQAPAGPAMVSIDGANGELTLERVLLIVNEVELKLADGSCDALTATDPTDDCPEFEAPPRFLDLPLDGEAIDAVTARLGASG